MGIFHNWLQQRILRENKGQAPDYSFDTFVKRTQELEKDVRGLQQDAEEKDKELDKKKQELDKEKPEASGETPDKDDETKEIWNKIKSIAKDRSKKPEPKQGSKSGGSTDSKPSTDSDEDSQES